MYSQNFNLLQIDGIDIKEIFSNINTEEFQKRFNLSLKVWNINNKIYKIIKYNKGSINTDNLEVLGLFRSIILSNEIINVFSPPKSLNYQAFCSRFKESDCIGEDFIEGTMINLFYDNDVQKWEIATKTSVGANVSFFKEQSTFSELFWEICRDLKINFNSLPKDICYSFIMQHPKNQFVLQIKNKCLYLITAYKIDNNTLNVSELSHDFLKSLDLNNVKFPNRFMFSSYTDIFLQFGSTNTNPSIMGLVIRSNDGTRTKIRNPNYEYIKNIRGNNSKLQYQYLSLRNIGNVKEYLMYFPKHRDKFSIYRKQLHDFTNTLHLNYINCFVKKEKKLSDYPYQFKIHMYELHQKYLIIRHENKHINKDIIINYVNNLPPARLMYSLNYHFRDMAKNNVSINNEQMEIT